MPSSIERGAELIAEAMEPKSQPQPARWRWGTVEAVGDGVMQVRIGGASVPGIRCASHVMGAGVGDRVRVAYYGADAIVDAVRATGAHHAPFAFRECAAPSTNISSGTIAEVSATVPTVSGYTRRGAVQAWATGSGTVIVGAPWCSGNTIRAKVRANNAATNIVVHFYVIYEYTG